MILRQGCARVVDDPGAHKSLNLGECARVRQDRQGFLTYCARTRKIKGFFFFLYIRISDQNPGDPGVVKNDAAKQCPNPGATLAQPWRRERD